MQQYCIIQCRVSTGKQAYEGESLDTQENICRGIAEAKGWKVRRVFREPFSGRADYRPIFDEMTEYIRKHPGQVHYVIFRCIDRFTRAGASAYETLKKDLAALGVSLIDSYGIIQPPQNTLAHLGVEYNWSRFSPSEIAEVVMAIYGKTEVTNILTRLIGREIELVRQGYQIGVPNDGYLNQKITVEGKKKVIQVPDPERATFYQAMYEMRAAGHLSDPDIVGRINAMGYRTKTYNVWNREHTKIIAAKGGVPLTVKRLQEVIRRPIYAGVICERWTNHQPIRAKYAGLVSIDTFNHANRGKVLIQENADGSLQMLYDQQPTRLVRQYLFNNPLFPYKSVIRCSLCRSPFKGSCPRGKSGKRFPTYHCGRGHRYFGVAKAELEGQLGALVAELRFRRATWDEVETKLWRTYERRQEAVTKFAAAVRRQVTELRREQDQAIQVLMTTKSEVARAEVEKRIDAIAGKLRDAEARQPTDDVTEAEFEEFVASVRFTMEHLEELLLRNEKTEQIPALFGLVFTEFPTYAEVENRTPKLSLMFKPFRRSERRKSELVHSQGLRWNTLRVTVRQWLETFHRIDLLPARSARFSQRPQRSRPADLGQRARRGALPCLPRRREMRTHRWSSSQSRLGAGGPVHAPESPCEDPRGTRRRRSSPWS